MPQGHRDPLYVLVAFLWPEQPGMPGLGSSGAVWAGRVRAVMMQQSALAQVSRRLCLQFAESTSSRGATATRPGFAEERRRRPLTEWLGRAMPAADMRAS